MASPNFGHPELGPKMYMSKALIALFWLWCWPQRRCSRSRIGSGPRSSAANYYRWKPPLLWRTCQAIGGTGTRSHT